MLSTSLLLELSTITVDPAYLEVAARRADSGVDARSPRGYAAGALMLVIGMLCAVAFSHTRRGAPEAARARGTLVARIEGLTRQSDSDAAALAVIRGQLASERDRSLQTSSADRELARSVGALQFAAGAGPVAGAGATVRLADAPPNAAAEPARVQDRDVQRLVNVAWSAGAEAVAVNGQRIGALTAIRQAGESILVDYRPVASPYIISAIGDPSALEKAFTVSSASAGLRAALRSLDFSFEVDRVDHLELAAATSTRTLRARAVGASPGETERSPQQ